MNAVMAMYEDLDSSWNTERDSKAFNVKGGLHQRSVLSPPTICDSNGNYYQRAMSRFGSGITVCRGLILLAESDESLCEKIIRIKSGLEAKGLKINTGKTKLMFGCSVKDRVEVYVS